MDGAALFRRTAATFNHAMIPALRTPIGRRLIGHSVAVVTYTGRKSGRQITLPVAYKRRGDQVTIGIAAPSAKTWWRNFTGDGGPISLDLAGTKRDGHAVAHREDDGSVNVRVALT